MQESIVAGSQSQSQRTGTQGQRTQLPPSQPSRSPPETPRTSAPMQPPAVATLSQPSTTSSTQTYSTGGNPPAVRAASLLSRAPAPAAAPTASTTASVGTTTHPRAAVTTITNSGMHHHFMSPWDLQLSGAGAGFNYYVSRSARSAPGSSVNGMLHHPLASELGPSMSYGPEPRMLYTPNAPSSASAAYQHAANSMRSHFRTKVVCVLDCRHCGQEVCRRAMKAILLADMNIELFSTDAPPYGVQLVNDDYQTRNCFCRIRDVACLGCGNVIGYHVTQPCEPCMDACNNGHFWMFHVAEVQARERVNGQTTQTLLWSQIPRADKDQISQEQAPPLVMR